VRPEVETAAVARNALRLHEDLGAFRQPLAASAAAAHSVALQNQFAHKCGNPKFNLVVGTLIQHGSQGKALL